MWRYFVLVLPSFAFNCVVPVLAGLIPAYYGWSTYKQDLGLRENGKLVEAHITEKTKKGLTYHIKYSFIDNNGIERKAERELGAEYNEMVNLSDYFLITYLPTNPTIHIIGARSSTSMRSNIAYALVGFAILLFGLGAWGFASSAWHVYRVYRLFTNGSIGSATVGDWIQSPKSLGKQEDRMTFHFVASNGRWYEGRSRRLGVHVFSQWPKGSHIKVAYDPTHPAHCEPDVFRLLN